MLPKLRYGNGGVRRFALLIADGMSATGAPQAAEGPVTFPIECSRPGEALDRLAG